MIKTISDFLKQLLEKEKQSLDKQNIKHRPTIGEMYEGLTKNLLDFAIPEEINLDIVGGFIVDENDELSQEIDCMIVTGQGEPIPYTYKYKYMIDDVIAVVQVKKNLYSDDLKSGYDNLLFIDKFKSSKSKPFALLKDAFQLITRQPIPDKDNVKSLLPDISMIYYALVMELMNPIRIILGYNGFKSEYNLRQSFGSFINDKVISKNQSLHFILF